MKYDVFISHSTKDKDATKLIVDHLENNGLKCFVSYRDIPHCDNWAQILMEAIQDSAMVVYIHSKNSNKSEQVTREIQISVDSYKKPCITYRLSNEPFKGGKAFFIQTLNWIDSLIDPKDGLDDLVISIRETLEGRETKTVSQTYSRFGIFIRKHKVYLISCIAILCIGLLAIPVYNGIDSRRTRSFMNEERIVSEAALNNYKQLILHAVGLINTGDSLAVAIRSIDEAESIAGAYSETTYKDSFHTNLDQIRNQAMAAASSMEKECAQRIRNFYRSYQLIQMEETRNDIKEELKEFFELNSLTGNSPDDDILQIKASLDL